MMTGTPPMRCTSAATYFPPGLRSAMCGRFPHDLRDILQGEADARLMRHGRQVQHGIGRAAGRTHDRRRRCAGCRSVTMSRGRRLRRISSTTALPDVDGIAVARLVGRRRAGREGQREADHLGHAGHGVGGELAAAGTRAGAGVAFELVQLLVGHVAGGVLAHRLEDVEHGHVAAHDSWPGMIEPPYMNTLGTFRRIIDIITPGSDLSQPAMPTSAS